MNRRRMELSSGSTIAHMPTGWQAEMARTAMTHQGLYGAKLTDEQRAIVRENAKRVMPLIPLLEIVRGDL